MTTYLTPGVYVEELATLPPSVAEVATAVPAFLGYTAAGSDVVRISSVLEFEQHFGEVPPTPFTVTVDTAAGAGSPTVSIAISGGGAVGSSGGNPASAQPASLLPYAIRHYFTNGGGPCYVVPIGALGAAPSLADFTAGLDRLRAEDEPTLLVFPDAVALRAADYFSLADAALALCAEMKDRFALLDVPGGDVAAFRNGTGTTALAYGAAYHPYLVTSIPHAYDASAVVVSGLAAGKKNDVTLAELATTNTAVHNAVTAALAGVRVVLPPSAAMAGVFASVDRDRGVWKAPANVSVAGVLGPITKITDADQGQLNVDSTSGKSINAVRSFAGRGTLVWGARTLAGNDNEWRYVPVRRLFLTIEESIQKASAFAVFEPNDATTWLKVKGLIENYLYGLWQQGALAGVVQEDAFFVRVGLGQTMTAQDVLEGRLIVAVGIAAVRPAEFVIVTFSHLLQQS